MPERSTVDVMEDGGESAFADGPSSAHGQRAFETSQTPSRGKENSMISPEHTVRDVSDSHHSSNFPTFIYSMLDCLSHRPLRTIRV